MPKSGFWGGVRVSTPFPSKEDLLLQGGHVAGFRPDRVYIPMQQHIGAPCEPVVKVGDRVAIGQLIGDTDAFVSAPVHASVSGQVAAIGTMPQANGREVNTVVIENDRQDRLHPAWDTADNLDSLPADEIVAIARKAGLVGMGGATFPTHVKLRVQDTKIDTVILNGTECEPMLAADDALMQENAQGIIAGAKLAMRAVGAQKAFISIEANKPKAIENMRSHCADIDAIDVVEVKEKYPQGSEKQLIQTLTGRAVPEGALPSAVAVVVLNVGTVAALANGVQNGRPVVERICTVTGDVANPQNIRFPLGTLVQDVIDYCGGFSGNPARVLIGGPMMGQALSDLAVPLTKGANGILILSEQHDEVAGKQESPCIRCNRCVEVCPMRLMPLFIDKYARKDNWDECERLHAPSCINCGCCTYVCPASRKLAQTIVAAKGEVMQRAKERDAK